MNRPPKNWLPRARPISGDPDPPTLFDEINAIKVEIGAMIDGKAPARDVANKRLELAQLEARIPAEKEGAE